MDREVRYRFMTADAAIAQIMQGPVRAGQVKAVDFFGLQFTTPLEATVYPSRDSWTSSLRALWRFPTYNPRCWEIGAGGIGGVHLVSPRVWRTEACGTDPDAPGHFANITMHAVVHALHYQHNPPAFSSTLAPTWVLEGLAVYVSGQLAAEYSGIARPRF